MPGECRGDYMDHNHGGATLPARPNRMGAWLRTRRMGVRISPWAPCPRSSMEERWRAKPGLLEVRVLPGTPNIAERVGSRLGFIRRRPAGCLGSSTRREPWKAPASWTFPRTVDSCLRNHAGIAQLEERLSYKQERVGSIPAPRTNCASVAQSEEAPGLNPGRCRFESGRSHHAHVAQLAEASD